MPDNFDNVAHRLYLIIKTYLAIPLQMPNLELFKTDLMNMTINYFIQIKLVVCI